MMNERVLVLDGSMGVQIQRLGLDEKRFRGLRFAAAEHPQKGNNDLLVLTCPENIAAIHRSYLEAGADIITTNTFNSNAISQKEYGTQALVHELNLSGARLARAEADRYMAAHPERNVFVAGSMGPTSMSASLPCDVADASLRAIDFDTLRSAYHEQALALIEGGVDILLLETIFDLLNAKAAISGISQALDELHADTPLILSFTLSDNGRHILSGHEIEAILTAIAYAEPLAVGFNCSFGPESMKQSLERLSKLSPFATIVYPNAGLPDIEGNYDVSAQDFARVMGDMLEGGLINIAGGCCGTAPEHIAALREIIDTHSRRRELPKVRLPWLAGTKAFDDTMGFINVGERCNVAGSRKFLRLVREGAWDEACAIARKQVADGAQMLDINMDDAMLDTPKLIAKFLRLLGADPEVAAVPWMIDSSDFSVIETALKEIPGKAIVNSISLKHGEEEFLHQAKVIRSYGAAVIVMAFDEDGQATDYEHKTRICARAYNLLTLKAGFSPRDIVFDPNVLTVATGMPEHDAYGRDFIEAVRYVSTELPGAKTSGGLSNLSFAFRGNNYLRQAMHAVFLYHAIRAGMSMAIMDPGAKVTYSDIPAELVELIEDVILMRRADATERLVAAAGEYIRDDKADTANKGNTVEAQAGIASISDKLVHGDDSDIESLLSEALSEGKTPAQIIEQYLMAGMERVGELFGDGRMFLPQVVKSARVMHKAVSYLRPFMEQESAQNHRKEKAIFLVATVRGDVHDIGKNIVSVVLRCNNFRVIDLGVQVDAQTIVDAALKEKPDFIGLSGLITPSLGEMANTVRALAQAGINTPVFVGGAATSELHTALHIAPEYTSGGVVVRVGDAAQNPVLASRIMANPDDEKKRILSEQERLRSEWNAKKAQSHAPAASETKQQTLYDVAPKPSFLGKRTLEPISIADVRPFINWTYFYNCWKVRKDSPEAASLLADAEAMLDALEADGCKMLAALGFYRAYSTGDSVVVRKADNKDLQLDFERQSRSERLCLSDFIAPEGLNDHIGAFMVSVDARLREKINEARESADEYRLILLQSVCDRLAEAASEYLHHQVRVKLWGYAPDEDDEIARIRRAQYRGIRPAVGYPSIPDQKMMFKLLQLVDADSLKVTPTENGALEPSSTVAGFYFASSHSRYFSI